MIYIEYSRVFFDNEDKINKMYNQENERSVTETVKS